MKVDAFDATRDLVERNVVEAFETSSTDSLDSMIWNQEVFFPPHEQMLFLHPIFVRDI